MHFDFLPQIHHFAIESWKQEISTDEDERKTASSSCRKATSGFLEGEASKQTKELAVKFGFGLVRFDFRWVSDEQHVAPGEPTSQKCRSNKECKEGKACELTRNECQDWNKKPLGVFRTHKFGLVAIYGWSDDAVIDEGGEILQGDPKMAFYHKMRDYETRNETERLERTRVLHKGSGKEDAYRWPNLELHLMRMNYRESWLYLSMAMSVNQTDIERTEIKVCESMGEFYNRMSESDIVSTARGQPCFPPCNGRFDCELITLTCQPIEDFGLFVLQTRIRKVLNHEEKHKLVYVGL